MDILVIKSNQKTSSSIETGNPILPAIVHKRNAGKKGVVDFLCYVRL